MIRPPMKSFASARNVLRLRTPHAMFVAMVLATVACATKGGRSGFNEEEQNATEPGDEKKDDDNTGGFGPGSGNVQLDPKNTTIIIDTATDPATPATLDYKVTSAGQDATATAEMAISDPTLGSFAGAKFTSIDKLPAGKLGVGATVQATTKDGTGLARLTIVQLRKSGAQRDFFFVVPYGGDPSPKVDTLTFGTNLQQADVAFVMDTTSSMGSSITNFRNALQGTLLANLQAAIPNIGLAIVDFRDFGDGANVLRVRQRITTTLADAQNAAAGMSPGGGGDLPEASLAGLHHTLTGDSNGSNIPAHTPPLGTWGGVDFRAGSIPILVHVHDNEWHDPSGIATMSNVTAAFVARKAKLVNIAVGTAPEDKAESISDATGSNVPVGTFPTSGTCSATQCCTDTGGKGRNPTGPGGTCRLNLKSANGNDVSTGIVQAVQAIATGSAFNVKAALRNDPQNPKGVDATKFVKTLRAMDEGNAAGGCPAAAASDTDGDGIKDTFLSVRVGTKVCFEVIPAKNSTVKPEEDPQFFNAFVDVIGVEGDVKLDSRTVLFLVPPKDPGVN